MAAVIDLRTGRQLAPAHLVDPPGVPALRLIEGGASPQRIHQRRIYLRRRILVLVAAALVVATVIQGAGVVMSALFASAPTASSATYTIAPGDTLWGVAGRVAPSADRRQTVDDLEALNGTGPLRVGQRLVLPGSDS